MSARSLSVIMGETSCRGKPPSDLPTSDDLSTDSSLTRTVRQVLPFPSNGLDKNSASKTFICAALTSAKKSFSPGPNPACMAPSIFAAAALHAGLVSPKDALHQSIAKATPHAWTPNSATTPAQKRSASEVTFGFLAPSAPTRNRANKNAGPKASATFTNAAVPGARSLTSVSFSVTPDTTHAPSFFENEVAFFARAPKTSKTLERT
mmetsp:Transcript_5001/g.18661  ORF Transcript_5001/g.18661 Transcript_5001/m.18661 type:complete len:207 (-) Transcript_5001:2067-2687(-)